MLLQRVCRCASSLTNKLRNSEHETVRNKARKPTVCETRLVSKEDYLCVLLCCVSRCSLGSNRAVSDISLFVHEVQTCRLRAWELFTECTLCSVVSWFNAYVLY